jgi:hypothetical protein
MVTNMLPIYHMCTEILKECLAKFDETDDIYIGIVAAIEKLNKYYDNVSPMVGIALILDPTMKKDFFRDVLEWEPYFYCRNWKFIGEFQKKENRCYCRTH